MKKYTPLQIILAVVLSPVWFPLAIATSFVRFNWLVVKYVWNSIQ